MRLESPVGNLLFLGPTGSGKTRIVEAAAEILFGDSRALIKVDCAEFQHSHEIAKLIGSPPGYLGHRETHPLITQEELAKSHRGELKLSFLLFDEIEKASDALWQLLLGILDQSDLNVRGQPESRSVADGDLPDFEPGRGRNHGIDARRDGFHPAEGHASQGIK
jgi:ATP-dependent Clp protease ATP-binding subunit ClpA